MAGFCLGKQSWLWFAVMSCAAIPLELLSEAVVVFFSPPAPLSPQCFIWHVHTFPSPRLQFCLQFFPHGGVWGVGHCFKFRVLAELLVLSYVHFAPQALVCRDDLLCWVNWAHFSLRCCSGTEPLVKDSHEALPLFWDHILFLFFLWCIMN